MATWPILPGYDETVPELRRFRVNLDLQYLHSTDSAGVYPMQMDTSTLAQLQKKFRLSQKDFDDIKQNAKVMWTNIVPKPTTYNTYFSVGEITELTPIRPTSRNRRNNPHPPEIFLTNGLHKIEAYKDSGLQIEGKQIEVKKLKYGKNHDSLLRKSYQDLNQFKEILPLYEAQAANSWVKLADECDQKRVLDVINDRERRHWENNKVKMCSKTASPSLYRWMRISGIKENDESLNVTKKHKANPTRTYENCHYVPRMLGELKKEEILSIDYGCCNSKLRRGEYSMHPEWPSTLTHHKIY